MRRETLSRAISVFVLLLLVFGLFFGCQQQAIDNTKAVAEEEMKTLAENYTKVFNTGNMELLEQCIAPEITFHSMNKGWGKAEGMDAFKELVLSVRTRYPDMVTSYNEADLIIREDKMTAPWVFTGTSADIPGNIADTPNKRVEVNGVDIIQSKDGKIVNVWRYLDRYSWAVQLDYLIKSPAELAAVEE